MTHLLSILLIGAGWSAAASPGPALIGTYELQQGILGGCHEGIFVRQEFFLNSGVGSGQVSLSFYGLPQGSGKVIAQVLDIDAGLQQDRDENPMSMLPVPDVKYRRRLATWDGAALTYRQGKLARFNPDLDSGTMFQARLEGERLVIESGEFYSAGGPFGLVQNRCVYKRVRRS